MSFMTPLWWIRAFEIAQQARRFTIDPLSMSAASGLSPALTDTELNGLLVLIQLMQEQILRDEDWVTFEGESLQKHNPDRSRLKSFLFQRIIQLLRAIRIEPISPRNPQDATEPCLLFEREERRQAQSGVWQTAYKLSPLAPELILGYAEPYRELQRLIEGKSRVHRYLGSFAPLPLRPSVWLDMVNLEQFVFLQLQKATFWERSHLHWDSLFGKSFDEIFADIELPARKATEIKEPLSQFNQKLRLLKKVGRKLSDHGLLGAGQEVEFLAVDDDTDPLAVIWFGREILGERQAIMVHEARCAQFFQEQRMQGTIEALIPVLSHHSERGPEAAHQLWKEILSFTEGEKSTYLRIEGNLLLSLPALYFEWKLRIDAPHPMSLPPWVRESEAFRIVTGTSSKENVLRFARILIDQSDYRRDIERIHRSSLATPVSLRQPEVLEYLATHTKAKAKVKVEAEARLEGLSPSLPPIQPILSKPSSISPAATEGSSGSSSAKKGYNIIEAKRQVNHELQKMRERQPERYSLLKQEYLANLEQEKKDIIFEMKERMQPQAFDDHLKNSLVKFMIDHPRVWQNGESRFVP